MMPDLSPRWSAWRVVTAFGFLSLTTDIVSDGASSLAGPLLAQLGASALIVGLVTGAGEAIGLGFRLVSGPWADRTRKYWKFTLVGYLLTVVCVPLLALSPVLGGAGLVVSSILILGDGAGKAVRSPSKTVLLASAASAVGRGRGFAVHKALDQTGSLLGPLLAAGIVSLTTVLWPAFAIFAVPGAVAIVILTIIRRRVPDVAVYDPELGLAPRDPGAATNSLRAVLRLPGTFYAFAAAAFAANAGLVSYGIISFRLTTSGLLPLSTIPLVYAVAMAAAAVGALGSGFVYDKRGTNVLLVLPFLISLVPGLALSNQVGCVIVGVIAWGAAAGIRESTVKAMVADLVPATRRATAYGIFAAFEGVGALVAGILSGALYQKPGILVIVVMALQACSLTLLLVAVRWQRRRDRADPVPVR